MATEMADIQGPPVAPAAMTDGPLKQKKKLLNGPHFVFTYPNGSVYEGAFKDGKLHGFGVYKYMPSGDLYEGEWKADMKHGHGHYRFASGDSYIGTWYMGKKHGRGKFSFASGDEYYGGWKTDVMDGYGVFRLERNGNQYEGFWEQGLREGLGVLRMGCGSLYDGEWSGGKENGFGVLQDVNGSIYCGAWKSGLKDGKGVEQDKGMIFLTEYLGGYLISKQPYSADDACEDGEWAVLLHKLRSWTAPPPLTLQPTGFAEKLDADAVDRLKRTIDDWRSAYLTLFDRVCQQEQEQQHEEAGKACPKGSSVLTPDEETVRAAKHDIELLKSRIQLLEAALGERMLDSRRMQDTAREKEATIHDLRFQLTRLRGTRRMSTMRRESLGMGHVSYSVGDLLANGAPPEGADDADGSAAATAMAELQKQNVSLSQANYAQQQKLTVLSAENRKLGTEVAALEDNIKEMEELLTSLLMGANGMKPDGSDEGADTNTDQLPTKAPEEMSESELRQRLRQVNQNNAELLVHQSKAQKDLDDAQGVVSALKKQLRESAKAQSEAIDRAVAAATTAALAAAAKSESEEAPAKPAPLPDWRTDAEHEAMQANVAVDGALLDKEKRIARLQSENAELSRLVEELRFQLDDGAFSPVGSTAAAEEKKKHRSKGSHSPLVGRGKAQKDTGLSEELEKSEADLKKTKKKLKRLIEERNGIALELYNTQCSLARVNRVPLFLRGELMVAVALQDTASAGDTPAAVARVKDEDPTEIEVDGVSRAFHFDACFPPSISTEHLFMDLKPSLVFAAQGFQTGLVGFGACRRGSRNVICDLLPFLVEGLRSECTVHEQGRTKFRVAYRVGAAEMDGKGTRDCFSGKQLTNVVKDAHGFVKPRDLVFVDCGSERLVDLSRQPLEGHAKGDTLSHLWMQIQVIVTHKVEQTTRCGRLTIFDLAGLTPDDEFGDFDAASTRYAKRSLRQINELLSCMQTDGSAIPYSSSVETSLLFDLLGGNSMTTVLGAVPAAGGEEKELLVAGLTMLESIGKVHNGPLLQDFASSDELRWREIVSAISSPDQALPECDPVEDVVS